MKPKSVTTTTQSPTDRLEDGVPVLVYVENQAPFPSVLYRKSYLTGADDPVLAELWDNEDDDVFDKEERR